MKLHLASLTIICMLLASCTGEGNNPKPATPTIEGGVLVLYPTELTPEDGTIELCQCVTAIGERAFEGNTRLRTIKAPQVKQVGARAFAQCTQLTTVELPLATTIGDNAFVGTSALSTIALPKAEQIGNRAFVGATALLQVHLPQVAHIGNAAFAGCQKLEGVTLSSTLPMMGTDNPFVQTPTNKNLTLTSTPNNTQKAEEWALLYGFGLLNGTPIENKVAPPTGFRAEGHKLVAVTDPTKAYKYHVEIPEYFTELANGLFENVRGGDFSKITAPGVEQVGNNCFHSAFNLRQVTMPKLKVVGSRAFYFCTQLSHFNKAEQVEYLGTEAFAYCKYLEEVRLPHLKEMGEKVFDHCERMHKYGKLYLGATPPTIKGGSVGSYKSRGKNTPTPLVVHTLIVPKGARANYQDWPHRHLFGRILEEGEPGT